MTVTHFPPVDLADPSGLIAVNGDLEVKTLETAYKSGIFPWPHEGYPLLWFAPPQRAILDFKNFKIPKRLQRELKKADFTFRIDGNFKQVILECAKSKNRKDRGTWILPHMIDAYVAFHAAGFAHSFETYNAEGKLVGGMYGVKINKMFCGESMFYKVTNASKFALIKTVEYLKSQGTTWMDIQMLTPLLQAFGAKEIPRQEFMKRLNRALEA